MWTTSTRLLTLVGFCGLLGFTEGTCPVPACYCNISGDIVPIVPNKEGNEVLTGVVAALVSSVVTGGVAAALWFISKQHFNKPSFQGYKRQGSDLSSRSLTRDVPPSRVLPSNKQHIEDRLVQSENTGMPRSGPTNVNVYRAFGRSNDGTGSSMSHGDILTDW